MASNNDTHEDSKLQYVCIEVTDIHHITIAFLGKFDFNRMEELVNEITNLPFPSEFEFGEILMLGKKKDIETLEVKFKDEKVEKAIRDFHRKFVQSGHISEKHLIMHVTVKKQLEKLRKLKTLVAKTIHVSEVGKKSPLYTFYFQ